SIVRPGDVYGPKCRPWVIQSMEMIKAGKMLLPANGKGVFTPVYIDDIVEGIVLAASKAEASGQIFTMDGGAQITCEDYFGHLYRFLGKNDTPRSVGTGTAVFIAEVVGRFERLLGKPSELGKNTVGMLARKGGYSIEKARRLLGYDPKVNLDEGMQRVKQWLDSEGQL
ncbi:MAG: NAD-dependent epimerase/dehydratase family protein, partial [Pseudomonadales bacterium]